MGISTLLTFTACNLNLDKLQVHPSFETMLEHPTMPCLNENFDFFIDVFGVYVVAPQEAPLEYVVHTSNVLAEYLDNDADGSPDDALVHEYLVEHNYIVPVWTESDRERLWEQLEGTECEDNVGMAASMYYNEDLGWNGYF